MSLREQIKGERVLLVALVRSEPLPDTPAPLAELGRLTETAGGIVAGKIIQHRPRIDPALFIGRGKAGEIRKMVDSGNVTAIIFDNNLTPAQERNLERECNCTVIDRTELILTIFAQRARSQEAQLQVELARLSYLQSRLVGHGRAMSQQVAKSGPARGPGEKKLEYDRRYIRKRVVDLKQRLEKVVKSREEQRKNRQGRPLLALVGYTNAGKSALLNRLTGADQLVENKLFATLDPTVRRLRLPDGNRVLLSDTVGFISELPPQLVASFKATLEEVQQADILLHVIDIAEPGVESRVAEVRKTLRELNASGTPVISVLNKTDLVTNRIKIHRYRKYPNAVAVSALTGDGFDLLYERIRAVLRHNWVPARIWLDGGQQAAFWKLLEERSVIDERGMSDDGVRQFIALHTSPHLLESLRRKGVEIELLNDQYAWQEEEY